jgi:hypothetical protein
MAVSVNLRIYIKLVHIYIGKKTLHVKNKIKRDGNYITGENSKHHAYFANNTNTAF